MADIYKRASVGDPMNGIPAETYNLMLDCIRDYLRRKGQRPGPVTVKTETDLMVQNVSGTDLAQFAVVGLGNPVAAPAGGDAGYYGDLILASALPISGQRFAVLQKPAGTDAVAPAKLTGWTLCRVVMNNADDGYAQPAKGDYTHLESTSDPTASAKIVAQIADEWFIVELTGGAPPLGFHAITLDSGRLYDGQYAAQNEAGAWVWANDLAGSYQLQGGVQYLAQDTGETVAVTLVCKTGNTGAQVPGPDWTPLCGEPAPYNPLATYSFGMAVTYSGDTYLFTGSNYSVGVAPGGAGWTILPSGLNRLTVYDPKHAYVVGDAVPFEWPAYRFWSNFPNSAVVKLTTGLLAAEGDSCFDGNIQVYDSTTEALARGWPVWISDLGLSSSLSADADYDGVFVGIEVHGPVYIATAANHGDVPPSLNWIAQAPGDPADYIGAVSTTLAADVDASQTTITVASSVGFPPVPFVVTIDTEQFTVTDTSGSPIWAVKRAANLSVRATHTSGTAVACAGEVYSLGMIATDPTSHVAYLYIYATAAAGVALTDTDHWQPLPSGINLRGTWSGTGLYVIGDGVQVARPVYAINGMPASGQAILEGYSGDMRGPGAMRAGGGWTWTCPEGVTWVFIEGWGLGGLGIFDPSVMPGKAGGGGAYAAAWVRVIPGRVYNLGISNTVIDGIHGVVEGATVADSVTGIVLMRAVGGNSTGGTGGQAVDCIGDVAFSGGDGGQTYWSPVYAGDGVTIIGNTIAGGGGGGGAGPNLAGAKGEDGVLWNVTFSTAARGGQGYSEGGEGCLYNNNAAYPMGLMIGTRYKNLKDNPGGGSGGDGIGIYEEIGESTLRSPNGKGRIVITWGNGGPTTTPGASITTGTLATGGTGANLTVTGPGFVKQPSHGAALTVAPGIDGGTWS